MKIVLFIILLFWFKKRELCKLRIYKSFGIQGFIHYNNSKNYVCPHIKKNCCTLEDQKFIIEKIRESETFYIDRNEKVLNSWKLLIETVNEFYIFEYYNYLNNLDTEKIRKIYDVINHLSVTFSQKFFYSDNIIEIKLNDIENIIKSNWNIFNEKYNSLALNQINFYKQFMKIISNNKFYFIKNYDKYISLKLTNKEIYYKLENDFELIINKQIIEVKMKNDKKFLIENIKKMLNKIYKNSRLIKVINDIRNSFVFISNKYFEYKKSIYCILCDYDNYKLINFEEKEIYFKKSFCIEILNNYKEKILIKYKVIYQFIHLFKSFILLFSFMESDDLYYLNEALKNSKYIERILNSCVVRNKINEDVILNVTIDECFDLCKLINMNRIRFIFDDIDPIFKRFTDLWILFKKRFNSIKKLNRERNLKLDEKKSFKNKLYDSIDIRSLNDFQSNSNKKQDKNETNKNHHNLENKKETTKNNTWTNNNIENNLNNRDLHEKFIRDVVDKKINEYKKNEKIGQNSKNTKGKNRKLIFNKIFFMFSKIKNMLWGYHHKLEDFEPLVFWLDKNFNKLEGKEMKKLKFIYRNQNFIKTELKYNLKRNFDSQLEKNVKNLKINRLPKELRIYDDDMDLYNNKNENIISILLDYYRIQNKFPYCKIKKKIVDFLLQNNKISKKEKKVFRTKETINIDRNYDRINPIDPFSFKNFKDYKYEILDSNYNKINIFDFSYYFSEVGIDVIYISGNMKDTNLVLRKINEILKLKNKGKVIEDINETVADIIDEYKKFKYAEKFNNDFLLDFETKKKIPNLGNDFEEIIIPEKAKIILKEDYYYYLYNGKIKDAFLIDTTQKLEEEKINYLNTIKNYYY